MCSSDLMLSMAPKIDWEHMGGICKEWLRFAAENLEMQQRKCTTAPDMGRLRARRDLEVELCPYCCAAVEFDEAPEQHRK